MDAQAEREFTEFVVGHAPTLLGAAHARRPEAAQELLERALARAFLRWRQVRTDPARHVLGLIGRMRGDAAEAEIDERDRRRLALHAIDRAHRLRGRRIGAVVVTVVLLVALAAATPTLLRHRPTAPGGTAGQSSGGASAPDVPTHVIDDSEHAIELVDDWYVLGNRLVLDRSNLTYRSFGSGLVLPSPNGRWFATTPGPGTVRGLTSVRYRVHEATTGANRDYEILGSGVVSPAGWSPDGTMLLVGDWTPDRFVATIVHAET